MAVVALAGNPFPTIRTQAAVGTNLQEFTIPDQCHQITVSGDAALWVQFTGSDGDATTATAKFPIAANGAASFMLSEWTSTAVPNYRVSKILVAAQSGTATVYVVCEGAS